MGIEGFGHAMADDALLAAVDLAGRTGATSIEIGYLHDDVPVAEADWYASAQYRGSRITVEHHPHPALAAESLARRLLGGAKCVHCGRLVTLDPAGAYARDATLVDGTPWLAEQQATAGVCYWRREGRRWVRGCEHATPTPRHRPKRRKGRKR